MRRGWTSCVTRLVTGPATIYEYHSDSVAYFALDAPYCQEVGELKEADLGAAQHPR